MRHSKNKSEGITTIDSRTLEQRVGDLRYQAGQGSLFTAEEERKSGIAKTMTAPWRKPNGFWTPFSPIIKSDGSRYTKFCAVSGIPRHIKVHAAHSPGGSITMPKEPYIRPDTLEILQLRQLLPPN